MRKKTGLTIVERAILAVPGFKEVSKKMEQQVILRGQSISMQNNYIRRIVLIALHFENIECVLKSFFFAINSQSIYYA